MEELKKEEEDYKKPEFQMKPIHPFNSPEERERILYENFLSVNADIQQLVVEVQQFAVKS